MHDYIVKPIVPDQAVHTEVVVIGNGPSGLCLSQLLAGYVPYLTGTDHPDELLAARLRSVAVPGQPLLEQDLRFLSQGLEGRSRNPLALLLDALARPGADIGLDLPSLLEWRLEPERMVDHVVLGRGPPGGAWHAMDGSILTLSLSSWMELPGLSFRTWEGGGCRSGRVPAATVARYYSDYVEWRGIRRFMRPGRVVTSVRPLRDAAGFWLVEGYEISPENNSESDRRFCYCTRHVVLASGAYDLPNELGVRGENLAHHNLRAFETNLDQLVAEQNKLGKDMDPVLVVGAGLSAADAIIAARHRSLPVLHAFRRRASQVVSQLPSSLYPEYHKVHQMMRDGGATYPHYTAFPETHLLSLRPGRALLISCPSSQCPPISEACFKQAVWHKISTAIILVGARPDLSYLHLSPKEQNLLALNPSRSIEPRSNPIAVDSVSYHVLHAPPGLYALGPLAGDTFVRFVMGGAVGITAHIQNQR